MLSWHLSTTHTQLRLTLIVRQEESMSFGMIRSIALTQQQVYLFVKVPHFSFVISAIYSRPYSNFKQALWENLKT